MVYDKIIKGMTVNLRSIEEQDAEATFKMRSDPEKSRYIHRATGTAEDQRRFIQMQREKPGDYLFVVEDLQGKPIGMKGIYNYDPEQNVVESGRFIGYGSQVQNIEALMLSFDFAFDVMKVREIIMSALEKNEMMLGIQRRFGVRFTYRERGEGMDCDSLYSVLTPEAYAVSRPKVEALIRRFAGRSF